MEKQLKILMIGAHPDDNDFRCGGTALNFIEKGHSVRFLSVCSGSAGHHTMSPDELCLRRQKESEAASAISGIEYDIWDIPDCEVMADLETRKRMVCYIREYQPDIIFTHRANDYHADHRNVALLVQDASYLLIVPNFCPDVSALKKTPVIMYFYDKFKNPSFAPDVVVSIDSKIDKKYQMIDCYESQVYEWLPYTNGVLCEVPKDKEERLEWLKNPRVPRDGTMLTEKDLNIPIKSNNSEYREAAPAVKFRDKLIERYGEEGKSVLFAEAFQVSEYGSPLSFEKGKEIFTF
ncbi:MAG: PIG-L family deacetylase [Oscillospiraceae bacterium]|nr:PIG-L family deacetylase [Oscillospiraceae bacterium]